MTHPLTNELWGLTEEHLVEPLTEMRSMTQEVRDIRDTGAVPEGAVGLPQLNPEVRGTVEGLPDALAGKADLVNGEVPTSQIPAVALTKPQSVASRAAMLSLTDVQEGDVVIITAGEDKGSYMLGDGPASSFASWHTLVVSQDAPVTSVNGQVGVIVLGPGDVGAAPANHSHTPEDIGAAPTTHTHGIADVTGLDAALDGKADTGHTHTPQDIGAAPAHVEVTGDWPTTGQPGTIYWKEEES